MPLKHVTLLYRGPLASCNYTCTYCPFAASRDRELDHRADRDPLRRFVEWLADGTRRPCSVFFIPRGEALIHAWYQDAVVRLARLSHVAKVAVQTNLSCRLDWLEGCPPHKVGLWCTYHPGQVSRRAFLRRCQSLDTLGVRYSVGAVGLHEHLEEIRRLRGELRREVYLWVNAVKRSPDYYDDSAIRRIEEVDPWFRINLEDHACHGRRCRCGSSVFSVSGDGAVRRCPFTPEVLGNLYEDPLETLSSSAPCLRGTCRCHIGYVHLEHLRLEKLFREGILERAIEPGGA